MIPKDRNLSLEFTLVGRITKMVERTVPKTQNQSDISNDELVDMQGTLNPLLSNIVHDLILTVLLTFL